MNLGDVFINFSSNINNFTSDLKQVNYQFSIMEALAKTTEQRIRAFAVGAFYLGQAALNVMLDVTEAYGQLDQAMADLSTVLKGTEGTFNSLSQVAIDWSNAHVTSTQEVVKSMYDMASAGLEQAEILASVDKAATLATATMGSMNQATSLLTNTMNSFGKSADTIATPMEKADGYMNTFAYTVQQFKIILPELETGMARVAGAATAMGASVEDASVALSMVKTAGLTVSQAGTALKNFYERLADLNIKTGVAVKDTNGELLSVGQILLNLKEYYGGSIDTMAEFVEVQQIFGRRGSQVVSLLQNQVEALIEHEKAVKNSAAATEMASKREEGFLAQLQIMNNRIENLKIAFGESFLPVIKQFSDIIGNLALGLQQTDDTLIDVSKEFLKWTSIFGVLAGIIIPFILIISNLNKAIVALGWAASTASIGLNMLTFGIPALLTALGMIGVSIASSKGKMEEQKIVAEELAKEQENLTSKTIDLAESYKELSKNGTDYKENSEDLVGVIRELAKYVPGFSELLTIDKEDLEEDIDLLDRFFEVIDATLEKKKELMSQIIEGKILGLEEDLVESEKTVNDITSVYNKVIDEQEIFNSELLTQMDRTKGAFESYFGLFNQANKAYIAGGEDRREVVQFFKNLKDKLDAVGVSLYDSEGNVKSYNELMTDLSIALSSASNEMSNLNTEIDNLVAGEQLKENKDYITYLQEQYDQEKLSKLSKEEQIEVLKGYKVKIEALNGAYTDLVYMEEKNLGNLAEYVPLYDTINSKINKLTQEMNDEAAALVEFREEVEGIAEANKALAEDMDIAGKSPIDISEAQLDNLESALEKVREQMALQDDINAQSVKEYENLKLNESQLERQVEILDLMLDSKSENVDLQSEEYKYYQELLDTYTEMLKNVRDRLAGEKFTNFWLYEQNKSLQEQIALAEEQLELKVRIKALEESTLDTINEQIELTKELGELEGKSRLDILKAQKSEYDKEIQSIVSRVKGYGNLIGAEKERVETLAELRGGIEQEIVLLEDRAEAERIYAENWKRQVEENIEYVDRQKASINDLNKTILDNLKSEKEARKQNFKDALDSYNELKNTIETSGIDVGIRQGEDFEIVKAFYDAKQKVSEISIDITNEFRNNFDNLIGAAENFKDRFSNIKFEEYGLSASEYTSKLVELNNLIANLQENVNKFSADGIITPDEAAIIEEYNDKILETRDSLQLLSEQLEDDEEQVNRISTIYANLTAGLDEAQFTYEVLGNDLENVKNKSYAYEQALKSLIKTRAKVEDSRVAKVLDEEIATIKDLYEASLKLQEAYSDLKSAQDTFETDLKDIRKIYESVVDTYKEYNKEIETNNDYIYDTSDAMKELEKDISETEKAIDNLQDKYDDLREVYEKEEVIVKELSDEIAKLNRQKSSASDAEMEYIDKRIEALESERELHQVLLEQAAVSYGNTIEYIKGLKAELQELNEELDKTKAKKFREDLEAIGDETESQTEKTKKFIDTIKQDIPETTWGAAEQIAKNTVNSIEDNLIEAADKVDKYKDKIDELERREKAGEISFEDSSWGKEYEYAKQLKDQAEKDLKVYESEFKESMNTLRDAEAFSELKDSTVDFIQSLNDSLLALDEVNNKFSEMANDYVSDIEASYDSAIEQERYYLNRKKSRIEDELKAEAKKYDSIKAELKAYLKAVDEEEIEYNKDVENRINKRLELSEDEYNQLKENYKNFMDDMSRDLFELDNLSIVKSLEGSTEYTDLYYESLNKTVFKLKELNDISVLVKATNEKLSDTYDFLSLKSSAYEKAIEELIKQKIMANIVTDDTIIWGEKEEAQLQRLIDRWNEYKAKIAEVAKEQEKRAEEEKKQSELQDEYSEKQVGVIEKTKEAVAGLQVSLNNYNKQLKDMVSNFTGTYEELIKIINLLDGLQTNMPGFDVYKQNLEDNVFDDIADSMVELHDDIMEVGLASDATSGDIENSIEDLQAWGNELAQMLSEMPHTSAAFSILKDLLVSVNSDIEQLQDSLSETLQSEIVDDYNESITKLGYEFALFGDEVDYIDGKISALEDRIADLIELKLRALKDENVEWTSELESQLVGLVEELNILQSEFDEMENKTSMMTDVSGAITSGIQSTLDEFFSLVQEFGSEEAWIQIKGKLEQNIKRNIINTIIKSLLETTLIKDQIKQLTEFIVSSLEDGLSESEIGIIDQFIGSIGESVQDVAGVIDYITNAFGLVNSNIGGSLDAALVTLEEVRSGKVDNYFKSLNSGDVGRSENILYETLGLDKMNLQIQQQSQSYLQQIALNTASLSRGESIKPSNVYNIQSIPITVESGELDDPETFVIQLKDILMRELEFDNRAGGY